MIRTFEGKGRLLFAPRAWFNAVARWILGAHSESGTIRIRNTANPGSGGPSFDVDCNEVAKALDSKFKANYPKSGESDLIGPGITWIGGRLSIDRAWLRKLVLHITGEDAANDKTADRDPDALKGTSLVPDIDPKDEAYLDNPAYRMYDDVAGVNPKVDVGWERGMTKIDAQGHEIACGVSCTVCTHEIFRNGAHVRYFAQFDFDETGRLVRIVPFKHWHRS